jgi:2-succinyl-5-enolpyruvyl-6-hydroxy-3-cyclohexene-1-carboxylate synthase
MNPSTAFATVVVDELVRCGVREAVLAPGSRSGPLALALAEADRAGRLRLHVRIDERSAGFLAIGLIRGSGLPVPVFTTSGTAVANLHPAVLEASHAGLPLLVLSADRPPELRATGANQTTDQVKVFGSAVRFFHEVGTPSERPGQVAYWRSLVARSVSVARGDRTADPGPVHLNCALTEPLVPDGTDTWPEPLVSRDGPWTTVHPAVAPASAIQPGPRTVVVAGDGASQAARLAAEAGRWPLFAEPSSRSRLGVSVIPAYRLLLEATELAGQIERVLVFGHPTLSRPVTRLLSRDDIELVVVSPSSRWPDAGRRATSVVPAVEVAGADQTDWLDRWRQADDLARPAIAKVLAEGPLTGPAVATLVAESIGADDMLVVGSSNPVRDLDLAPVVPIRTMANRGLAGIDGTVSTAVGAALANAGPTYALVGDLTFLHDANGLVLGQDEPRPDLRIVVLNDNGGGIFSLLEQHDAAGFERVYGTPHNVDLAALCAATRTPYTLAGTADELTAAVQRTVAGIDVVEVRVDRSTHRHLHARLKAAVTAAL